MTEIVANVTLQDGAFDLLPHWLSHYYRLGVGRFFVCANEDGVDAAMLDDVVAASGLDARVHRYSSTDARYHDSIERREEDAAMDAGGVPADAWVLTTDLDEFHEYPCDLRRFVGDTVARGHPAAWGTLVERVAMGGVLHPLTPTPSVFEQYPYAADVVAAMGGCTRKVVCARRDTPLLDGNHGTRDYLNVRPPEVIVHHFKFRGDGIARVGVKSEFLRSHLGGHWYADGHAGVVAEARANNRISPELLAAARPRHVGAFDYGRVS